MDIPNLKFPRDQIIEIVPAAYQNEAKRIHIPGLEPNMVPETPDDIRVPGSRPDSRPGSGQMSPMPGGIGSPAESLERPTEKVINTAKDMVADKLHDED